MIVVGDGRTFDRRPRMKIFTFDVDPARSKRRMSEAKKQREGLNGRFSIAALVNRRTALSGVANAPVVTDW